MRLLGQPLVVKPLRVGMKQVALKMPAEVEESGKVIVFRARLSDVGVSARQPRRILHTGWNVMIQTVCSYVRKSTVVYSHESL